MGHIDRAVQRFGVAAELGRIVALATRRAAFARSGPELREGVLIALGGSPGGVVVLPLLEDA